MNRPNRGRRWTLLSRGTLAAAVLALPLTAVAAPAQAAAKNVTDATFRWGLNEESSGGAFFGGCNFLSAGAAGDAGRSRVWTEADGFYQTTAGNVKIEKPTADGGWVTPTWATKCQDATGTNVKTTAGSSTRTTVLLSKGTGTVDPDTGAASISWKGSFTVAYYGGMSYWTVTDPKLTVSPGGTGTLTGTASGYGTAMDDPSKWEKLPTREIVLADLSKVEVGTGGFVSTPRYLGVEVNHGNGTPQKRTGDFWGAFPQSFVDYQQLTGQSSYWYSSGGSVDPKKPTTALTVQYKLAAGNQTPSPTPTQTPAPTPTPTPAANQVPITTEIPEVKPEPTDPGVLELKLSTNTPVQLGKAEPAKDGGFTAVGQLPGITVTDTRPTRAAWSVTAQATDFSSSTSSFGAQALGWTPKLLGEGVRGVSAGAAAAPGTDKGAGLSQQRTLLSAAADHDSGSVSADAGLALLAPSGTAAGSYHSTVTLSLIG